LGQTETGNKRSHQAYLAVYIKGLCMGAADVVPGVSGGTMAFILGIYEELLESIRSFDLAFVKRLFSRRFREAFQQVSWPFLSALFMGIMTAVFSLARILSWLLENKPVLIWSFFFGLILASTLVVSRHLQKWTPALLVWLVLGTVGTYFMVGMVPLSTPSTPWFLFLSGAVAICAMILPGISGSFILVLLGKYHYVLAAVKGLDFLTLFVVAAGALFGLITFVRILNLLLKRYREVTITLLTGLMLGSLRKVWPWKKTVSIITGTRERAEVLSPSNVLPAHWDADVIIALCLMVFGFLVVFLLDFWASHKD
jgi:putative membrane protein